MSYVPPPPPFVIEKDRFRLLFNEPREQGCITIENGSGGICMFLNEEELLATCGALLAAYRRIKRNRKDAPPSASETGTLSK